MTADQTTIKGAKTEDKPSHLQQWSRVIKGLAMGGPARSDPQAMQEELISLVDRYAQAMADAALAEDRESTKDMVDGKVRRMKSTADAIKQELVASIQTIVVAAEDGQAWKLAADHALVVSLESTADSYPTPTAAINALIDWNVDVALDPLVSERARTLQNKA